MSARTHFDRNLRLEVLKLNCYNRISQIRVTQVSSVADLISSWSLAPTKATVLNCRESAFQTTSRDGKVMLTVVLVTASGM